MKRRVDENGTKNRKAGLSEEDHALWHEVRKSVEPLRERDQGKMREIIENASRQYAARETADSKPAQFQHQRAQGQKREYPVASYSPPISQKAGIGTRNGAIDDRTARKLLKGKISVDGRIDLHGMTQEQAYRALSRFLASSHGAGDRMILVITGKGRMSEGVLRQAVPNWLREPALSVYASAFRTAHITHGGEGALYVRLRRKAGGWDR